jgi:hypothetical protein
VFENEIRGRLLYNVLFAVRDEIGAVQEKLNAVPHKSKEEWTAWRVF